MSGATAIFLAVSQRAVRVGCLFCGLGLLMALSVQQYTIVEIRDACRMVERTGFLARTRVANQKPLACSNFASSHGGRVGVPWTIVVDHDHSSRCGMATKAGRLGPASELHLIDAGR